MEFSELTSFASHHAPEIAALFSLFATWRSERVGTAVAADSASFREELRGFIEWLRSISHDQVAATHRIQELLEANVDAIAALRADIANLHPRVIDGGTF